MGNQGFFDWLFSEAGAGWVFGIVTLIGLALALWDRKRPKRVVCREVGTTSLLRISRNAREKVKVFFADEPIDHLSQIDLDICNQGSETIEDVALTAIFQEGTRILDVGSEVAPASLAIEAEIVGENALSIAIPYLNPLRPHKHRVSLSLVCDGNVERLKILGGGRGWSVRHIGLPDRERLSKRLRVILACSLAEIIGLVAFTVYMFNLLDQSASTTIKMPIPMLVVFGLLFAGTIAISIWTWSWLIKRLRRAQ